MGKLAIWQNPIELSSAFGPQIFNTITNSIELDQGIFTISTSKLYWKLSLLDYYLVLSTII